MLLMACLLRFGALPPAADPSRPTSTEVAAVEAALRPNQEVFDTHRTRSAGASSGTSAEPLGLWRALRQMPLPCRAWLACAEDIPPGPDVAWEYQEYSR
jgi:hypothetical protein